MRRLPEQYFQPACRPVADELLDDTHGHSWLFCVQQRIAEWSGKNKQSHDECLAWPDRDPCGTQFYIIRCGRGCPFYLIPNMETVREVGIGNVVSAAMNQAFFTLSLGVAAMEIFGSYMGRDNSLAGEGARICALDTFVAIMAGLIIFPACFAYGVEPTSGPSLIFITLPNVFKPYGMGQTLGNFILCIYVLCGSFNCNLPYFRTLFLLQQTLPAVL